MSENTILMEEKSLGYLLHNYRIVIPEIQREYVWGDVTIGRNVLGHFFKDFLGDFADYKQWMNDIDKTVNTLRTKIEKVSGALPLDEKYFRESAENQLLKEGKVKPVTNVGFAYAYFSGCRTNEDPGRTTANLIDGQQRFTTYFLMLLHIAYKAGRFSDFLKVVRPPNGAPGADLAFDFNVRALTHEFLNVLIDHVSLASAKTPFSFADMPDATWYLQAYRGDVSIRSMTNALKTWDKMWEGRSNVEAWQCYDYLLNNVLFMFFPIRAEHGEQLYITMNGRGRNLSQPEIMRAKVFRDAAEAGENALEVGRLFEDINDFFWRHRIEDELTADAGEKKFFRWVYLLWKYDVLKSGGVEKVKKAAQTMFQDVLQTKDRRGEFRLDEDMFGQHAITYALIRSVFRALVHLFEGKGNALVSIMPGSSQKKRLIDYLPAALERSDEDSSFQQECFCLLPMLRYVMQVGDDVAQTDASLMQQLSLARYLHNLVKRPGIQKGINKLVEKAMSLADDFASQNSFFFDYLGDLPLSQAEQVIPEDEICKCSRLSKAKSESKMKLFELIWEIEDYKYTKADDPCLVPFLDIKHDWRTTTWDDDILDKFKKAFKCVKRFFRRLDEERLYTTEWLMFPAHRGYYLRNSNKVCRYSLSGIFATTSLLESMIMFESKLASLKVSPETAFNDEARKFMSEYWGKRESETDAITLAALALVASRLVRAKYPKMPPYDNYWANLEYGAEFYNHEAHGKECEDDGMKPIGGENFSLYFWHMEYSEKNWQWSDLKACNSRLLACHKVSASHLDNLVTNFCNAKAQGK